MSDLREALNEISGLITDLESEHEVMCGKPVDPSAFKIDIRVATLKTVVAALSAQPQPEAVEAVQWQFQALDGKWGNCEKPNEEDFKAYPERLRGLYTAPPLAPDERMRRALEFYADPFAWKKKHDPENTVFVPDHYDVSGFGDTAKEALSRAADASNASAGLSKFSRDLAARQDPVGHEFTAEEMVALYLPAGGDGATKSEGGINWTPFEDGTAPWSEDEQFAEAAKACKSRCKKFGKDTCDGEFEGNCTECERDAEIVLRKKYLKPKRPSAPTPAEQREAVARGAIMTTKAIEAGARAAARIIDERPFEEDYPVGSIGAFNAQGRKEKAIEKAKAVIEAALASGELVPASAVAAERERCVQAVRDERLEYMITPDDHSYNRALDHAEYAIRALSPEPASGEFVVVPRIPTAEMIEAGCEANPTQWNEGTDLGFAADVANDVYRAMLNAATKDGGGS